MQTIEIADLAHASTRPHIDANARPQFGMDCRVICSIWPADTVPVRQDLHIGRPVYQIKAAKRGEVQRLAVYDAWQIIQRINENNGHREKQPAPIPVDVVVEHLMNVWKHQIAGAKSRDEGAVPGIEALGPGEQTPSADLLDKMRSGQERFMEWWVNDANEQAQARRYSEIGATHRLAASWLYGDNATQFEWFGKRTFQDLKQCVACLNPMPAMALKCTNCNTDLVEFYQKHRIATEGDVAVMAFIKKMRPPAPLPDLAPRLAAK